MRGPAQYLTRSMAQKPHQPMSVWTATILADLLAEDFLTHLQECALSRTFPIQDSWTVQTCFPSWTVIQNCTTRRRLSIFLRRQKPAAQTRRWLLNTLCRLCHHQNRSTHCFQMRPKWQMPLSFREQSPSAVASRQHFILLMKIL